MANSASNVDRTELSRIFVQCRKNRPQILTDFGASLKSSGGSESEHSLVELDSSGLAWQTGFRNNDVIEAVDATSLKVKGVNHRSLVEYLREDGQTCNMLIRRAGEAGLVSYSWIAFRIKTKGGKPVVAKRDKRSVGPDIDEAERVHKKLPKWALRTSSSTNKFLYDNTVDIRLVAGEGTNQDRILGFYEESDNYMPMFTTNACVLQMHKYVSVNQPINGTVVAFSCGQKCLAGNSSGVLQIANFPPFMTGTQTFLANSRMYLWKFNNDQSGSLSPIDARLFMSNVNGVAALRRNKYALNIREDGGSSASRTTATSTSIYPSLGDVGA